MIHAPPAEALGAVDQATAEAELRKMRGSLQGWLRYRAKMDAYAAGQAAPALLRRGKPLPPTAVAGSLRSARYQGEQDLANTLHSLLVDMGCDATTLPSPDVSRDPDAAPKLAQIAIGGRCPGDAMAPQAPGFIWLIAIPVAGAVLIISQYVRSKADVEKERERLRCIQAGACTDTGFWLKIAAIATTAWVAWDKFGLREAVEKRKRRT